MYVRSSFTVVNLHDLWINYPVVYGTIGLMYEKVGQAQILGAVTPLLLLSHRNATASQTPVIRLPSQPQSIAGLSLVPNYAYMIIIIFARPSTSFSPCSCIQLRYLSESLFPVLLFLICLLSHHFFCPLTIHNSFTLGSKIACFTNLSHYRLPSSFRSAFVNLEFGPNLLC